MALISQCQSFSTENLFGLESIKMWREYLAEVYCRQDVRMENGDRVLGKISERRIGEISVSHFRSGGAQRVIRTKELAKIDNIENFHFAFPYAGKFAFQQGVNNCEISKGGAHILNASNYFHIDFSSDAESYVFIIPCEKLRRRIIGIDDFVACGAQLDPLLIRTLSGLASDLINIETMVTAGEIEEICISLIEIAVVDARNGSADRRSSSNLSDRLVEKIRAVIRNNCADPDFDLTDLANICGVSKRQIQKVLSEHSTTFSRELLNTRLSLAAHLLKAKNRLAMTTGQISTQCGFTSQSHFSSRYRERFGVTPRKEQRG